MNIAVFIKSTTFHKNHGGLEVQNRVVCEELVKRGSRVVVFTPKGDVEEDDKELNGVKYYFIKSSYKNYIFAPLNAESWYRKSLAQFSRINDIEKFDLVLSQSASGESIIENKRALGVKVVSIAHGTTSSEFITFVKNISNLKDIYWLLRNTQYFLRQYFGRQRRYVLHSDRVIAVSNYVKNALISETFSPENMIEVIQNGVDESVYENLSREEKQSEGTQDGVVKIYFIGRVEKSKGILTIIDILKDLKDVEYRFHVVGEGPCLEDAKRKVRENGIEDRVIFEGRVPHLDFIKNVKPDIFVFPTKRIEGFPMVLVESMFGGIPVVAFDCGGVSDAVEDEKTGYLVKAGDITTFREQLKKLITNKGLRLELGRNAREKAMREFTINEMIDKYEKVFKDVLK